MREFLGRWIADQARADPEFLMLSGDHGYALFDPIRTEVPAQFINVGVMEQAMVSLAAGLAKTGFHPWVYGLAAFIPIRVMEQIKIDVCYSNLPVVFFGDGAGLVYSTLGASHHCGEDLACVRALPNLAVYTPADEPELACVLKEVALRKGPSYIRIGKSDRPTLHSHPLASTAPVRTYFSRGEIAFLAHGSMSVVARDLASQFQGAAFSFPRLVPFPKEILSSLSTYKRIFVLEEHQRSGGLFSALLEEFAASGCVLPKVESLSLKAQFAEFCGSHQYALSEHGLSDEQIVQEVSAKLEVK